MPTLQDIIVTVLGLLALAAINYGMNGLQSLDEEEQESEEG
jgi:hypothetical protein